MIKILSHLDVRRIHGYLTWVVVIALTIVYINKPELSHLETYPSFIVNACITIITLSFSAILVATQLASAQFSPRIGRNFFVDNYTNQSVFYAFLLGITYCTAIQLYDFDKYFKTKELFKFEIFLIIGVVYGIVLLVIALPYFVFNLIDSINAASITNHIFEKTTRIIKEKYPLIGPTHHSWDMSDKMPAEFIISTNVGFVSFINEVKLVEIVEKYPQYKFEVKPVLGNFISKGEPLLIIHDKNYRNDISPMHWAELKSCFHLAKFRNASIDFMYGIRQLVDIAIKAISPAVNDPTTCLNCLDYLGEITLQFMICNQSPKHKWARTNNLNYSEIDFDNVVDLAFDQIYQWGRKDIVIIRHTADILLYLLSKAQDDVQRSVLIKQIQDMELESLDFETKEFNGIRDNLITKSQAAILKSQSL